MTFTVFLSIPCRNGQVHDGIRPELSDQKRDGLSAWYRHDDFSEVRAVDDIRLWFVGSLCLKLDCSIIPVFPNCDSWNDVDRCSRTQADIDKIEVWSLWQRFNILCLDNESLWMSMIRVNTSGTLAENGGDTLFPSFSNVFSYCWLLESYWTISVCSYFVDIVPVNRCGALWWASRLLI